MIFANKFCSHFNYYNLTHDTPDLVFESVYLFNMNPANLCLFKVNNWKKSGICSQLTIKTLEWCHWYFNSFTPYSFLVLQLLTLNTKFLVGTDDIIKTKILSKKIFSSILQLLKLVLLLLKICLSEDGTRMGGI